MIDYVPGYNIYKLKLNEQMMIGPNIEVIGATVEGAPQLRLRVMREQKRHV